MRRNKKKGRSYPKHDIFETVMDYIQRVGEHFEMFF